MSTKRTIMAGWAAVVMIISGCSDEGMISAPNADRDENATAITRFDESDNSSARGDWAAGTKNVEVQGTMQRTELEGGCWYLQADNGERYEPSFPVFKGRIPIYEGLRLAISGYLDPQRSTICMIGPVLVVEKYEAMAKGEDSGNDREEMEVAGSRTDEGKTQKTDQ